jgi:selenocysteine lyase/cysteine desulfurase
LTPLTHHFLSPAVDGEANKLMPGGPGYELVYAATGVLEYLLSISPIPGPTSSTSLEGPGSIYSDPETQTRLEATFAAIAKHEQTLVERVLGHLTSEKLAKRGVRVVGEEMAHERRAPTISFVVVKGETGNAISGKDIVKFFDAKGTVGSFPSCDIPHLMGDVQVGIRYGNFYAYTLVATLTPKVDMDEGLVRISFVHYNTIEEVDRVLEVLDEALGVQ